MARRQLRDVPREMAETQAYGGYLIHHDALRNELRISKGGHHIGYVPAWASWEWARHLIDYLNGRRDDPPPTDAPRRNPKYGKRAGEFVREEMHHVGRSAHVRTPAQAVAVGLSRARRAGVRVPQANPAVLVFGNPPRPWDRATVISQRAVAIEYDHTSDGELYRHDFKNGVVIEALVDGSVRLYRPDGKPIWRMFNR